MAKPPKDNEASRGREEPLDESACSAVPDLCVKWRVMWDSLSGMSGDEEVRFKNPTGYYAAIRYARNKHGHTAKVFPQNAHVEGRPEPENQTTK